MHDIPSRCNGKRQFDHAQAVQIIYSLLTLVKDRRKRRDWSRHTVNYTNDHNKCHHDRNDK